MRRRDAIPEELRQRAQWVVYRLEARNGKRTKAPYQAVWPPRRAVTTNPNTWASFDQVAAVMPRFDGVGYVFSAEDPYTGVDIDRCVNEMGLHRAAARIVKQLDSYAECSPSRTGMHVIVRAELRGDRHRTDQTPWGGLFEAFDRAQFFTFTGIGTGEIGDRQRQLDDLVVEMFPPAPAARRTRSRGQAVDDDAELLATALGARNGRKLQTLYDGDTSAYDGDRSRADYALVRLLAFWTSDPDRIERLMRGSRLTRDKWDEIRGDTTYLRRTIERAM